MASNIQFRGIEYVVNAYVNRAVPSFAIWLGKQLLFPFATDDLETGRQTLESFLKSIAQSGGNPVYTLRVYEDLEANGKIKEKTVADGSFNFQLDPETDYAEDHPYLRRIARIGSNNSELLSRLAAIENKLQGGSVGNPEPSTLDHLKDFCDTEAGKIAVPQIIGAVLSMLLPGARIPGGNQTLGAISGITPNDSRIAAAITILKTHDAKLDDHLEKLANLAETNPAGFQSLIAILDKM